MCIGKQSARYGDVDSTASLLKSNAASMQVSRSRAIGGCGTVYEFSPTTRNIIKNTVIHLIHRSVSVFRYVLICLLKVVGLHSLSYRRHLRDRNT